MSPYKVLIVDDHELVRRGLKEILRGTDFEVCGEAENGQEGLAQTVDVTAIENAAREVILKYPDNVAKFKSGNEGVFKFFVGQVMKATKGQANPQTINEIVRKFLSA